MRTRLVWAWLGGTVTGFFICCFLVYPPHAAWNDGIELGDVATWLSSAATTAAIFVALYVAAAEGRRSAHEAEKVARRLDSDDRLNDYRTALLVQPALANAHAACGGVIRLLRAGAYEFSRQEKDILLEVHAFKHLADLAEHAKGASDKLVRNLLPAIAYSHQMVIAIDTCLELVPGHGFTVGNNYAFTGTAARDHVFTTVQFVAGYVLRAKEDVESAIYAFHPAEPFEVDFPEGP